MSDIEDNVFEVFEVLEESIKNYIPEDTEEVNRIEKIKKYLQEDEIKTD